MITNNIIGRTFLIAVGSDTGTCFTYENKLCQYLITAKHVLESLDCKNGDTIQVKLFHDKKWPRISCKFYVHENEEIDIALLELEEIKFPIPHVNYKSQFISFGEDLFFFGFPYGMYSPDDGKVNNKFPIPFVKKGVLSNMINEDGVTSIYLDAHNNTGFSGGPVIQIKKDNSINVIGVNVSYLKHDNTVELEEQDFDGHLFLKAFEYYENSGIMKAHSIHHIHEIIKQNGL